MKADVDKAIKDFTGWIPPGYKNILACLRELKKRRKEVEKLKHDLAVATCQRQA